MSYIGNQPAALGTYATQTFTGNASLTAFTLSQAATTATILVSIDGVDQIPTTAYSVAVDGVTLNFTSPPPASTISVRFLGDVVDFGEPSDDSVATAKIQDDAVTAAKLANSINTEIAANTAKVTNATHTGDVTGATALTIAAGAVDIPMLSASGTASATTYLRGDNAWSAISAGTANQPNFGVSTAADQSWSGSYINFVMPTVLWESESNLWDTTNYKFTVPAGKGGKYVFHLIYFVHTNNNWYVRTYINGTTEGQYNSWATGTSGNKSMLATMFHDLSAGDTVEIQRYTASSFTNGGAKFMGMRIDE